jgi:hypothetical protein
MPHESIAGVFAILAHAAFNGQPGIIFDRACNRATFRTVFPNSVTSRLYVASNSPHLLQDIDISFRPHTDFQGTII